SRRPGCRMVHPPPRRCPLGTAGRSPVSALARSPEAADVNEMRRLAQPLRSTADLDSLMERVGDARFVLVGEASHGTAEFYGWRAALTRRLIGELGFSFVAGEGDWPDCFRINRWV